MKSIPTYSVKFPKQFQVSRDFTGKNAKRDAGRYAKRITKELGENDYIVQPTITVSRTAGSD